MKKLNSIFIFMCLAPLLHAQITTGAIAFLGFQGDAPDAFAFVTLQDFNPGDSIFITDAGWNGSQFFVNEGVMRWKADQVIPAGAVVRIQDPNDATVPNALIDGPGVTRGKMSSLTLSGDQLFAYTLVNGNQVPVTGFSTNAFISICDASGIGNTPRSCLPANLTLGINAIQLNDNAPGASNPNNAFFNQVSISGTPAEIAQIVNNPSNWIGDEAASVAGYSMWPNWEFNLGSIGEVQVGFLIDSLEIIEGGNPQEIEISINPPLNLPKSITAKFDLIDGIEANDLLTVPPQSNGIIQIELPANVSSFSLSIEAGADDGTEGNELGILRIISADEGLLISEDSLIHFEIIENPSISFVSFTGIGSNVNGIESQSFDFTLAFTPITAENSSLTLAFQSSNGFTENDFSTSPPAFSNEIVIDVPAGTSTLPLSFQTIDDMEIEPTENTQLFISNLSNNLQAGQSTAINFSIADNDVPVSYQNLNINEVMVNNTVTISDEFSEYNDWIEIQNSGDASVSLSNLFITNDPLIPNKFQFSSSPLCNLAPGSFKLVWADDSVEQGPLHLNFELNNLAGYVGLYALQTGNFGPFYALIDSVYYPAMSVDRSYAYFPDSENNWILVTNATPGLPNDFPVGQKPHGNDFLLLYPNPANNQFSIKLKNKCSDADIVVINSSGQTILNENIHHTDFITFNTYHWTSGVYHIRIISDSGVHTQVVSICK